ncbi:hypothetical protein SAMN04487896_2376 [Paenibacillus sp. ov031]|nr:hypothetical protein SAMN04487896_2376 [Paenibacillus sp. ov031]
MAFSLYPKEHKRKVYNLVLNLFLFVVSTSVLIYIHYSYTTVPTYSNLILMGPMISCATRSVYYAATLKKMKTH